MIDFIKYSVLGLSPNEQREPNYGRPSRARLWWGLAGVILIGLIVIAVYNAARNEYFDQWDNTSGSTRSYLCQVYNTQPESVIRSALVEAGWDGDWSKLHEVLDEKC